MKTKVFKSLSAAAVFACVFMVSTGTQAAQGGCLGSGLPLEKVNRTARAFQPPGPA